MKLTPKTVCSALLLLALCHRHASGQSPRSSRHGEQSGGFAIDPQGVTDRVDRAKPHRFFDSPNLIALASLSGANTFDIWTTRRGISTGAFHESNPIAKPFVNAGTGGQIVFFYGINTGGPLALAYILHRTGHHKLERVPMWIQAGVSASYAGANVQLLNSYAKQGSQNSTGVYQILLNGRQ